MSIAGFVQVRVVTQSSVQQVVTTQSSNQVVPAASENRVGEKCDPVIASNLIIKLAAVRVLDGNAEI